MTKTTDKTTPNQARAISSTGKNVLVSASAGSGKTFVMIERIIKLITEQNVDVGSILAVTYTNLAASEMKQKLVKAVIKKISEGKDVARMRRTLDEIPTADISTMHSFCLNLLKTYFYVADVDPDFTVAEESKRKELSSLAIDGVFNELYKAQDADFLKTVRIYRKYRGDGELKNMVLQLFSKCVSEENPEEFLLSAVDGINESTYAFYEDSILQRIKDVALAKTLGINGLIEDVKLLNPQDGVAQSLALSASEIINKLTAINKAKTLSDAQNALLIELSAMTRKKTTEESVLQVKSEISDLKADFSKICKELCALIPADRNADLQNFLDTKPVIKTLANLTLLYARKFDELKDKDGVLDFNDLEIKTLKLLKQHPDVLSAVREKYSYVFADEYQDVNGVQEEILNLISQDNLFMVGDVKQSIYAFRGCNPEIFAKKYDEYEQTKIGDAIPLDKNFRSSDGVLSAVNNVFSDLITKEHGGVDYKNNPMQRGGLYEEGYGSSTLHLIEKETADKRPIEGLYDLVKDALTLDEEDDFYEGALVAKIIQDELTKTFYDEKIGKTRKVELSDVAVLTRSAKGYTDEIVKRLVREGIPVVSESRVNVLDFPEIKLLVDLVKLINYYADDPPLVAVLKSAVGNVSDEELAKIRRFGLDEIKSKEKPSFLDCLEVYQKNGTDVLLRQKLLAFDEYFSKIRVLSEFMGAGELIAKVLRETGLDYQIASKPLGKIRLSRVERFIAESTPDGKKLTIAEFLDKINSADTFTANSEVSGSDSVKVMSMHGSKGLEFPVVIIPGLHKKFNAVDDRAEVLFSRKNGLAVYHYDEDTRKKTPTLANVFFKQSASLERANEEARVFYVAMTRAKSRLHLVSTSEIQDSRAEEKFVLAKKFTDFLSLKDMPVITYAQSSLKTPNDFNIKQVVLNEGRQSLTDLIYNNLSFAYPHQKDVTLPVKTSVTAINARQVEMAKRATEDFAFPHFAEELSAEEDLLDFSAPLKVKEDRQKQGVAYHRFLQLCDFNDKNADNQLIGMLNAGLIEKSQAELLNVNDLNGVLALPVWDTLKGYKLYKEQPFMTYFSARELYGDDTDAKILVQGIIDLLAVKDGKVILIDYKFSDHLADRLKKDYQTQLSLYKKAIEKCLKLRVEKTFILALPSGLCVEI
ncbi:MAG: UvrD-helicase domain-containing protein [Clostridia bacterium]|nr:UvrD-helicase domain-containing protein [Clostridia bacterium]